MCSVNKAPILEYVVKRVKLSHCKNIIICTSSDPSDDPIFNYSLNNQINVFRGSLDDVLGRFNLAIKKYSLEDYSIVRITADNPLIDPKVIDLLINIHRKNKNSVTTNFSKRSTFAIGNILSIIDANVISYMSDTMDESSIREHIVYGFNKLPEKFKVQTVDAPQRWCQPNLRYTIDYPEDITIFKKILKNFQEFGYRPTTEEIGMLFEKDITLINYSDKFNKKWEKNLIK
jgi:spore coat polysaccharide biosynthesis protein SpsF